MTTTIKIRLKRHLDINWKLWPSYYKILLSINSSFLQKGQVLSASGVASGLNSERCFTTCVIFKDRFLEFSGGFCGQFVQQRNSLKVHYVVNLLPPVPRLLFGNSTRLQVEAVQVVEALVKWTTFDLLTDLALHWHHLSGNPIKRSDQFPILLVALYHRRTLFKTPIVVSLVTTPLDCWFMVEIR